MSGPRDGEGRFSRWSRMKREARLRRGGAAPVVAPGPGDPSAADAAGLGGAAADPSSANPVAAPDPAHPAETAAGADTTGGDAATPGEAATPVDPADLPDIETLDENSDYTVFLQDGVPEELRRLALRKLWRSNPIFANLDGLNDYDEDFRLVDTVIGETVSAFRKGRETLDQATAKADGDPAADAGAAPADPAEKPGGAPGPEGESGERIASSRIDDGEIDDGEVGDGEDTDA